MIPKDTPINTGAAADQAEDSSTTHNEKRQQYDTMEAKTEAPDRGEPPKSWKAPIIMMTSLAIGIGSALAHHFMCESLDGQLVDNIALSQAWVSRFSTAIAFLVKMTFAVCVGTAYVQHQWLRVRQQPFRAEEIDALTTILGNIFSFVTSSVWTRHPVLALMAIVSWGIPLAAITAPGSLTVRPAPDVEAFDLRVPQPYFDQEGCNFGCLDASSRGTGYRITTSGTMLKLAYGTAATGEVLPLSSKYQNETYDLQFDGPAVKCIPANSSVGAVQNVTARTYNVYTTYLEYVAWVPGGDEPGNAPPENRETLDYRSSDATRIFIMADTGESGSNDDTDHPINVTECLLYNASYSVSFHFAFPRQSHSISIDAWHHPVNATSLRGGQGGTEFIFTQKQRDETMAYLSLMDMFGHILVGDKRRDTYGGGRSVKFTSFEMLKIDWSAKETIHTGLEKLFQNFTLSLLSDDSLIRNESLAKLVPVEVETWPVTYHYAQRDLLLAYGIALACALVCSIVGLHAFFRNDASYQNLCTTYLRAIKNSELQTQVRDDDTGADPLPKPIAQAEVILVSNSKGVANKYSRIENVELVNGQSQ